MKITLLTLFSGISICPVWAQVTQSHPEYCGISAATPPNVSATVDPNSGDAVLNIGSSQSGIPLLIGTLPSFITRISEICTLPDGRLVAFGDLIKYPDAAVIFIVDPVKKSLVDSFTAYRPLAISPNQRWLVFGKFCSSTRKGVLLSTLSMTSRRRLLTIDLGVQMPMNRDGSSTLQGMRISPAA